MKRGQAYLFSADTMPPLRALVNFARLHKQRVAVKELAVTKGLEVAVDRLTRAVDAILDGDTAALNNAGIDAAMAEELARRLQSAAVGLRRRT